MFIESGLGNGNIAGVSNKNQLLVLSESRQIQHHISKEDGLAFQLFGYGSVNLNTNVLYLQNKSQNYKAVFTYIRMQAISLSGGTALPSQNTYFSILKNPIYVSGGGSVNAENVNFSSANSANVIAYNNNPSLSSLTEIDRIYVNSSDQYVFSKEGSIILGANDSIAIRLNTDHTNGFAYARFSFLMVE